MINEYQPCIGLGDPVSYRPRIEPVILADWENEGTKKILDDFSAPEDALHGADLLFAYYSYEDYSGRAYVLFAKDDKFYEVHGTHCSCHGLEEDGWNPEEYTLEELRAAIEKRAEWQYEGEYTKEAVTTTLNNYLAVQKGH